jgi:hypothetical protein
MLHFHQNKPNRSACLPLKLQEYEKFPAILLTNYEASVIIGTEAARALRTSGVRGAFFAF